MAEDVKGISQSQMYWVFVIFFIILVTILVCCAFFGFITRWVYRRKILEQIRLLNETQRNVEEAMNTAELQTKIAILIAQLQQNGQREEKIPNYLLQSGLPTRLSSTFLSRLPEQSKKKIAELPPSEHLSFEEIVKKPSQKPAVQVVDETTSTDTPNLPIYETMPVQFDTSSQPPKTAKTTKQEPRKQVTFDDKAANQTTQSTTTDSHQTPTDLDEDEVTITSSNLSVLKVPDSPDSDESGFSSPEQSLDDIEGDGSSETEVEFDDITKKSERSDSNETTTPSSVTSFTTEDESIDSLPMKLMAKDEAMEDKLDLPRKSSKLEVNKLDNLAVHSPGDFIDDEESDDVLFPKSAVENPEPKLAKEPITEKPELELANTPPSPIVKPMEKDPKLTEKSTSVIEKPRSETMKPRYAVEKSLVAVEKPKPKADVNDPNNPQASQRHHAVFIAQTNVTSLVYKVEMAVSRVLIVACLTFLAAFASLAQAYEYKQQCQVEQVCAQYVNQCQQYENVCLQPYQKCKQYEQICVQQQQQCKNYQTVEKPVKVCVQYEKECIQFAYKEQCKQQEQVVQQQYWYRRWYKQEVPVKQVCQKQQYCVQYQENKNKCAQYGTQYQKIQECVQYENQCVQYGQGKCLQYEQACQQYGQKCANYQQVCKQYQKVLVCKKYQQEYKKQYQQQYYPQGYY